ncbi:serine hydrolase domain-containing protein [Brevibacillus daliensis]|uniref:serine hydrolase domain-containing protein n=1 Tax=Brevibacillus daliensis TaxID=2892995 RepID=UPI001E45E086|nr:serine hydrolase domain-containing protein [Brevibacillus daliensis]
MQKGKLLFQGMLVVALLSSTVTASAETISASYVEPGSEYLENQTEDSQGKQQQIEATYTTNVTSKPLKHNYDKGSWDQVKNGKETLDEGSPKKAGMLKDELEEIDGIIEDYLDTRLIPGAVVLVARKGTIVKEEAYGYAVRYADQTFTPIDNPIEMEEETLFDVASVSKLFTSIAIMQLVEDGDIELDEPVATYIPEFASNGKENITVTQLLTHTSGMAASKPIQNINGSREERFQAVFADAPINEPGSTYLYSDLNMIVLGAVVERITGQRLDEYVEQEITEPLDMENTMYNPSADLLDEIAATEYSTTTSRGLVWGQVHDEKAWALDGVAGHAGVFSTAPDLAILAQMMLNDGVYDDERILEKESVRLMMENQIPEFPGNDHGLGWEVNQDWYMDGLTDLTTMGHTGFTGTSIVVSPSNQTIVILLTNRVHPSRNMGSINPIRREVARQAALAIPVSGQQKKDVWFAGTGDKKENTLTTDLRNLKKGQQPEELRFETWYRIQAEKDYGYVEATTDGVNWEPLTAAYTDRSDWVEVTVSLPDDVEQVRFRYSTDDTINGRGWYVAKPTITDKKGKKMKIDWEQIGFEAGNGEKEKDE